MDREAPAALCRSRNRPSWSDGEGREHHLPTKDAASAGAGAGPAPADAASSSVREIGFLPSPSLHDGRFANDGWLQELPDPLTKLTWDNPALLSPKTAKTLGLASQDLSVVDHAGRSLDLPFDPSRHAGRVVALTLGYGR